MSIHKRMVSINGYTAKGSTEAEIERLLFHMPVVAVRASNPKAKAFACDIVKLKRFRNWKPKPKQVAWMQSLVADLFQRKDDDEVIDAAD